MIYDTYAPTEQPELEKIFELMQIQSGETFCDLGSGDGRVVIHAAQSGATATGIEYDTNWCTTSINTIQTQNIQNATILQQDFYTIGDFSQYKIIYTNLSEDMCVSLWDKFVHAKNNGSRIFMYMGIEGFRRCHNIQTPIYDNPPTPVEVIKFNLTHNPWFLGLPGYNDVPSTPQTYTHVLLIMR